MNPALAPVDALRALPAPLALAVLRQIEAELGPEAVGALGTAWEFWRRPAQRFPHPEERPSIVVYAGEYGAGKTRTAWELLQHRILTGRARAPRILAATGADARSIVAHPLTGILAWARPGVTYAYEPSKGYEGELRINGVCVTLLSADAPRAALGVGCDVQLLDDPPKWGPAARPAFVAALKSCRERGALTIIPTTIDGVAMLGDVLEEGERAGVLTIPLGASEENAGNLDPAWLAQVKGALERAGQWNPLAGVSPWAQLPFPLSKLRLEVCPPLVELGVSIDPNKGGACEVGIVGGGRDARSTIHVRHDVSAVLGDGINGWPRAAWDLVDRLRAEHPDAAWHFVLESNVGKRLAELLRAEEQRRCRAAGRPEVSTCEIRLVRADKDKCVRAVSPARLGAQEQVRLALGLTELEGQLRDLTPFSTKSDRADAANHLITDLAGLDKATAPVVDRAAAFVGFEEAQRAQPAPAWGKPSREAEEPEDAAAWDRV